MRVFLIGPAALAALTLPLLACSGDDGRAQAAAASPDAARTPAVSDLPQLRPGRWMMRNVRFAGDKATREMLDEDIEFVCIAPGADLLQATGAELANCPDHKITRQGSSVVVEAKCSAQGVDSSIRATYSGDLQSRLTATMRIGLAPSGQPLEFAEVTVEGRHQGACQGDET